MIADGMRVGQQRCSIPSHFPPRLRLLPSRHAIGTHKAAQHPRQRGNRDVGDQKAGNELRCNAICSHWAFWPRGSMQPPDQHSPVFIFYCLMFLIAVTLVSNKE